MTKKVDKYWDKFFKELDLKYVNALFKLSDIDEELIEELPSEYTSISEVERRADLVAKSKNGYIVDVEYEKKVPTEDTFFKSWDYCCRIYKEHRIKIKNYMFCVEDLTEEHHDFKPMCGGHHRIYLISLKNIDANKEINIIKNKIKNNEKLDNHNIAFLMCAIFTSYECEPHEMLMEVAKLTNKTQKEDETSLIDKKTLNEIKYYQINNCENLIDDDYQKEILEEIKMKHEFYDNVAAENYEKAQRKIAKNLKEKGLSLEFIHDTTKLPIEQIKTL